MISNPAEIRTILTSYDSTLPYIVHEVQHCIICKKALNTSQLGQRAVHRIFATCFAAITPAI